jgi:Tfp pilus assembly protein PilX
MAQPPSVLLLRNRAIDMNAARSKHHGLALMLVLAVIAVAALIGIAMLSSASLQAQVGNASRRVAQADTLAESAAQAAIYYLQYPAKMPVTWAGTDPHVMSVHGGTLPGCPGSFDLDVVRTGKLCNYYITAIGYGEGANAVTRMITASVQTIPAKPTVAAVFGGTASIPLRHTINGTVISTGVPLLQGVLNGVLRQTPLSSDFVVPNAAQINYFGGDIVNGTYTMPDGTTGKPDILGSNTLAVAPTASATNPGKVFYYGGTLNITAPMNINGTIIARGQLQVKPVPAGTVSITAQQGFPALIVDDQLQIGKSGVTLQVNGVAWLGNGTAWILGPNLLTNAVFNGSVLLPTGKIFGGTLTGTVTVNYSNANVDLVNLTKPTLSVEPVLSVKVLSWNQ